MATRTIRISGNWRKGGPSNEWAGTGTVDKHGGIGCSAVLDGDTYDQIESAIADGETEGEVTVQSDDDERTITYHWEISSE
jgi:hypothetical protein